MCIYVASCQAPHIPWGLTLLWVGLVGALPRNCCSSPVCCRAMHAHWLQTKQSSHTSPHSPGLCSFYLLPLLVQFLSVFPFSYPSAIFRKIFSWIQLCDLGSSTPDGPDLSIVLQDISYICRPLRAPKYMFGLKMKCKAFHLRNLDFCLCYLLAKMSLWNLQEWCSWL